MKFEDAIACQVVLDDKPQGCLTNSDLEMVAVFLQHMVIQKEVEIQFAQAGVL